jgi:hypothetical protein
MFVLGRVLEVRIHRTAVGDRDEANADIVQALPQFLGLVVIIEE